MCVVLCTIIQSMCATLLYYNKGRRDANEPWTNRLLFVNRIMSCASCIHNTTDIIILYRIKYAYNSLPTTTSGLLLFFIFFFRYHLFFQCLCASVCVKRVPSLGHRRRGESIEYILLPPQPHKHTHTHTIIRY